MEPGKAPEHHSGERWSQEYMIFEEKSGDAGAEPLTYLGFVLISALPSQFETELYTDISWLLLALARAHSKASQMS